MATRQVQVFAPHVSVQNRLQALALRLRTGKALVARGQAEVERVKRDFYGWADEVFGKDTYVIFEAKGEVEYNRMVREMQEPREFDVDRLKELLSPEAFKSVTKTVVDTAALDNALARKEIDSGIVASCTTYGRKALLCWQPTGPRSEIKLKAGHIAVVGPQHVAQEV